MDILLGCGNTWNVVINGVLSNKTFAVVHTTALCNDQRFVMIGSGQLLKKRKERRLEENRF